MLKQTLIAIFWLVGVGSALSPTDETCLGIPHPYQPDSEARPQ